MLAAKGHRVIGVDVNPDFVRALASGRAPVEEPGLQVLTTHCSNNYGPHQFPEKLIPLMIHHALAGKPLPVYGDGLNLRDLAVAVSNR